jgi:hypothetical protein
VPHRLPRSKPSLGATWICLGVMWVGGLNVGLNATWPKSKSKPRCHVAYV